MNSAEVIALAAAILAPAVQLAYVVGEHFGAWDRLSGRADALAGLRRLKSGHGYPESWIYDDAKDQRVFKALASRISRLVTREALKQVLADGHRPSLITIGGSPIALTHLPPQWPAEERRVYVSEHPVIFVFGVTRNEERQKGKAERACSIGDLERDLERERGRRQFWFGTVAIVLIGIAMTLVTTVAAE
jgi:hypothetical protein